MGLLQRAKEIYSGQEETGRKANAGVGLVYSPLAAIAIAIVCVGVAAQGFSGGGAYGLVIAAGAILVGGVFCWRLIRDTVQNFRRWRG